MEISVENVVASASAGTQLDLQEVSLSLEGAEYAPERFPGLIYRKNDPKAAMLMFSSGKMVCTGTKSVEMASKFVQNVMEELERAGSEVSKDPATRVHNIVATIDLESELNLSSIAITLGLEKVEYEPEQFPGLVYRIADPKIVALLFGSGKVVCTGAKDIGDIGRALGEMRRELKEAGLL